jgi:sugar/nucleoside kinase (ribokinase family)
VIKRGAQGAVVLYQGGTLRHRGVRATVIDTTGAGDAFNGGFLAVLVRGGRAVDALDVATFVGARATEALGGMAALPRADQLPRALRRHVSGR